MAAGGAALAYMLAGSYVYPWYLAWALPALVLCWRCRLTWLAMAQAAILHLATLPDPRLQAGAGGRALLVLSPLQRLQVDFYRVAVPLVQLGLIALVVAHAAHARRSSRTSGTGGAHMASRTAS
jgi:hypothetical protein